MDRKVNRGKYTGSNIYFVKLYYLALKMYVRKRCNQIHEGFVLFVSDNLTVNILVRVTSPNF